MDEDGNGPMIPATPEELLSGADEGNGKATSVFELEEDERPATPPPAPPPPESLEVALEFIKERDEEITELKREVASLTATLAAAQTKTRRNRVAPTSDVRARIFESPEVFSPHSSPHTQPPTARPVHEPLEDGQRRPAVRRSSSIREAEML
jgi:hypothetical protein